MKKPFKIFMMIDSDFELTPGNNIIYFDFVGLLRKLYFNKGFFNFFVEMYS